MTYIISKVDFIDLFRTLKKLGNTMETLQKQKTEYI